MSIRSRPDAAAYATLAAVALIAATGFYSFPLTDVSINTDSAVFSYIGSAMLEGAMPYADVFDHKGPLVYLINLLGALVPATWGLWIIETLFLACSLCLSYAIGRVIGAPRLASAIIPVLMVSYLVYHAEGGNMTEQYCLPFALAALLIGACIVKGMPFKAWHAFAMGACCAAVFMLRFTETIVPATFCLAALAVYAAKRGWAASLKRAGLAALGFAALCAPIATWLALGGALAAFTDQYLVFNLAYASEATAQERLQALSYFAEDTLLVASAVASVVAVAICWARKHPKCGREIALLLLNGAVLALMFAVAVMTGREYGHYALMFAPLYIIPFNAAASQVCRIVRNRAAVGVLAALLGLVAIYIPSSIASAQEVAYRTSLSEQRTETVQAIDAIAGSGSVLVIGNECWIYLDGGFRSPSPYAYRSDPVPEGYDAWLAGLVEDDAEAPDAIVVAEYANLQTPLHGYRELQSLHGFTLYARQ